MYGLRGYLLKAKALAPINARRVLEGGWYLKYIYWSSKSIATPEADLVAALNVATTLSLLKPVCCLILTVILNRAAFQAPTCMSGPNFAIPKVAITCDFWSKCLSTQAVPCGLQQWRVTGIITARDPKLAAADQPESWWDHVRIIWRIACCSYGNVLVIPPKSIIIYPGHVIKVRKSCNKSPWFTFGCDVTIDLQIKS